MIFGAEQTKKMENKENIIHFINLLIEKEEVLQQALSDNLVLYEKIGLWDEYNNTFGQWNKSSLVIWDLKDILCRME